MLKCSGLAYLLLFPIDAGLTLLALWLAKFLREMILLGIYLDQPLQFSPWLYLVVPVIWILVFAALQVYSPARGLRYTEACRIPGKCARKRGSSVVEAT